MGSQWEERGVDDRQQTAAGNSKIYFFIILWFFWTVLTVDSLERVSDSVGGMATHMRNQHSPPVHFRSVALASHGVQRWCTLSGTSSSADVFVSDPTDGTQAGKLSSLTSCTALLASAAPTLHVTVFDEMWYVRVQVILISLCVIQPRSHWFQPPSDEKFLCQACLTWL